MNVSEEILAAEVSESLRRGGSRAAAAPVRSQRRLGLVRKQATARTAWSAGTRASAAATPFAMSKPGVRREIFLLTVKGER